MSFIGCWNTSQDFDGNHKGYLTKGSVTVKSFFITSGTDEEVLQRAKELSKQHNHFLISISELTGAAPNYDSRQIFQI
jgi:hypothetical protein